ncbi:MAG: nickel pincer cofactor biosynthesis protein LarC [Deltaproteobacteria bacterium]|nr:MAG: nickel pincer cofactor biosynthesis protein LarC [Deltaproteobacteria bacterium]
MQKTLIQKNKIPGYARNSILYFDCLGGISGNMVVGALLDLGLPLKKLRGELKKLSLKGYRCQARRSKKYPISSIFFEVDVREKAPPERPFVDIRELISESLLDAPVKKISLKIFKHLAGAEAHVHNTPLAKVHFHEVGGVDTIVDIVGAAIGFNYFGIKEFYCSPLPMSRGWITSSHGRLPLPAPATLVLLKGVPTYPVDSQAELVTPTGAAIVTALAKDFGQMPTMRIDKAGYGAGASELSEIPNLLRLVSGHPLAIPESRPVTVIESHIDDMNPEFYDHLMDKLFEAGALDVSLSPIQMKKNRPGTLLRVISPEAVKGLLMEIILRETTTLGMRYYGVRRFAVERTVGQVRTEWGLVKVKIAREIDGRRAVYPEYEECRKIANEHNVPLKYVYQKIALAGAGEQVDNQVD